MVSRALKNNLKCLAGGAITGVLFIIFIKDTPDWLFPITSFFSCLFYSVLTELEDLRKKLFPDEKDE